MKILFVDPFASVQYLCENLTKNNIKVYSLYTSPPENEYVSIPTDLFEKIFFFEDFDAQEQVIAALSEEGFERIYYGSESSAALTDELALALTPAYANPLLIPIPCLN